MYRHLFPAFTENPELVYLDSGATTQKPEVVIDAVTSYYKSGVANPDRGLYGISIAASQRVLEAREAVATFIRATSAEEIIFTSGATAGINLVANGLRSSLEAGDEIILSELEHHSNILPWQQLATEKSLTLKLLPFNPETGEILVGELTSLLTPKTKVVALSLVSNVFGSPSPLQGVAKTLKEQGSGALFLIDASQAIAHTPLSVTELAADFVVFSGHKCYGPSGIGVLWGTTSSLSKLTPSLTGGGTAVKVTVSETTWRELPERLEGGTLNVEGIIGMATAVSWLEHTGWSEITHHLHSLTSYAQQKLAAIPGLTIISPSSSQSIISFTMNGIHAHDIAQACADAGICIRAGQHCAGPLHVTLNLAASARVSFGLYNTTQDVDKLTSTLMELREAYAHA
ncbi:cysteine desulfurase [soil metagenome]